jgi:hypothetical protein
VSQEIQGRKEISITSYNKLGYTTRDLSSDNKTKKEILVQYKKFERIFNNSQNKNGLPKYYL